MIRLVPLDFSVLLAERVVVDVLTAIGAKPRPLCVRATVFNPASMARVNESLGTPEGERSVPPHTEEEFDGWYRECGAYALKSGLAPHNTGKWAGHLITAVTFVLVLVPHFGSRKSTAVQFHLPAVVVGVIYYAFLGDRVSKCAVLADT